MSDAVETVASVTIKRVRATVYCKPAPLPPWKQTMLIGKPDLKKRGGWRWSATRNFSILNSEEKAAYKRQELLVIQVPDEIADWALDDLVAVLVP